MKKNVKILAILTSGLLVGFFIGLFFFLTYKPKMGILSIDEIRWYPSSTDNPNTPKIEGAYWVITMTVDYTTLAGLKFTKDGIYNQIGEKLKDVPIPQGVTINSVVEIVIEPEDPYYLIPLERTCWELTKDITFTSVYYFDGKNIWFFEDTEFRYGQCVSRLTIETLDYPQSPKVYVHTPFNIDLRKVTTTTTISKSFHIDTEGTNTTYNLALDNNEWVKLVSLGWLKQQRSDPAPSQPFSAFPLSDGKAMAYIKSDKFRYIMTYDKDPKSFSYYWFGDQCLKEDRLYPEYRPLESNYRPFGFRWNGFFGPGRVDSPGWSQILFDGKGGAWVIPYAPSKDNILSYLNSLVADKTIESYNLDYYKEGYSIVNDIWRIETSYTEKQLVSLWISSEIADAVYVTTPVPTAKIVDISPKTSLQNRLKITDEEKVTLTVKNTGTAKGQFDIFGQAKPSGYIEIYSPKSVIIDAGVSVNLNFTIKNLGTSEIVDVDITFYVKEHETGIIDDSTIIYCYLVPVIQTGTLMIWTEGEPNPNTAKIYVNGIEVQRNVGNTFQKAVSVGTYIVSFETIKNYSISIFVNNVFKTNASFTTVSVISGQTTSVKAVYSLTTKTLLNVLVVDSDYNPLAKINVSIIYRPSISTQDIVQTKFTNDDGVASFELIGNYIGEVKIIADPGFFSMYYPKTAVETVSCGSNSVTLILDSKLPFWIAVASGSLGAVGVGAYAYTRRRREYGYGGTIRW